MTYDQAQLSTTQQIGSSLTIPVQVAGFPVPTVEWTFSNAPVNESYVSTDSTSTNLSIKRLEPQHHGVFRVKASNVAGEATAEFEIILNG